MQYVRYYILQLFHFFQELQTRYSTATRPNSDPQPSVPLSRNKGGKQKRTSPAGSSNKSKKSKKSKKKKSRISSRSQGGLGEILLSETEEQQTEEGGQQDTTNDEELLEVLMALDPQSTSIPAKITNNTTKSLYYRTKFYIPPVEDRELDQIPIKLPQVRQIFGLNFPISSRGTPETAEIVTSILGGTKINDDIIIQNAGGEIQFAFFKKVVPSDLVEVISDSTYQLGRYGKPSLLHQAGRGDGKYFLSGYHAVGPKIVHYKLDKRKRRWAESLFPYLQLVREVIQLKFPHMWNTFAANATDRLANSPLRPYTGVQLNYKTNVGLHVDQQDHPSSLACLTTVGKYTGGELKIDKLGFEFAIQPGDLLFYQASKYFHCVGPLGPVDPDSSEQLQGRCSINLFMNHAVMAAEQEKKFRNNSRTD